MEKIRYVMDTTNTYKVWTRGFYDWAFRRML